jgi:hypothetical protein
MLLGKTAWRQFGATAWWRRIPQRLRLLPCRSFVGSGTIYLIARFKFGHWGDANGVLTGAVAAGASSSSSI